MSRPGLAAVALAWACSSPPPPTPVELPADAAVDEVATADAGISIDDLRLAAFTKVIQETAGLRHECWARGAADDYRLAGRVVLAVTLGADGAPSAVEVSEDTTGDRVLTDCLVERYGKHAWPPVFDAGTTVKAPLAFSAPNGVFTVSADHVPEVEIDAGKLLVQHLMHPGNTGNPGFGLTLYQLYAGHAMGMHRHAASAELMVVVSGEGLLSNRGAARKGAKVTDDDAIYLAPGAEHALAHSGEDAMRVLVLHAPSGPEGAFRPGADLQRLDTQALTAAEKRRTTRTRLVRVNLGKQPAWPIAGGKGWVKLGFDKASAGDDRASAAILHLDAGVAVPAHVHAGSTEVLYVWEGGGTMTVAGRDYPVAENTAIQIPPGVEHAFVASSAVTAYQFYTPSGPEQRFRPTK